MSLVEPVEILDSDDSIIELDQPLKPVPPVIDIEIDTEHEIILNIMESPACLEHSVDSVPTPVNLVPPLEEDNLSPYHWTKDMKDFYNNSLEGEENFDVAKIKKAMNPARRLWDEGNITTRKRNFRKEPCFNCGNFGHNERDCRPFCCHMCGAEGHNFSKCPNRKCLSCGKKTKKFVNNCQRCLEKNVRKCTRCKVVGHIMADCTDHWRRFHHVTKHQNVEPPSEPVYKPLSQMWCCNCAKKGHLEVQCRNSRSEFSPTSPLVSSYKRSFRVDKADLNTETDEGLDSQPSASGTRSFPNITSTPARKRRYFESLEENGQVNAARANYNPRMGADDILEIVNEMISRPNPINLTNEQQPGNKVLGKKKKKKKNKNLNPSSNEYQLDRTGSDLLNVPLKDKRQRTSPPPRAPLLGTPRKPSLLGTPRKPALLGNPRKPSLLGTPPKASLLAPPRRPSLLGPAPIPSLLDFIPLDSNQPYRDFGQQSPMPSISNFIPLENTQPNPNFQQTQTNSAMFSTLDFIPLETRNINRNSRRNEHRKNNLNLSRKRNKPNIVTNHNNGDPLMPPSPQEQAKKPRSRLSAAKRRMERRREDARKRNNHPAYNNQPPLYPWGPSPGRRNDFTSDSINSWNNFLLGSLKKSF